MNRKKVLWIGAAALAVAISFLLPGFLLEVQDRTLEGKAFSQEAATADLSLLSELSVSETLVLAREPASRVALEQGRRLTAEQVLDQAKKEMEALFGLYDGAGLTDITASPWLYMDDAGRSVILWEVELTGRMEWWYWYQWRDGPYDVTVRMLLDESSGSPVRLRVDLGDGAAPQPTAVPQATAVPGPGAEAAVGQADPEMALELSAMFLEKIGLTDAEIDIQPEGLVTARLDYGRGGEALFYWGQDGMRFNWE